LYKITRREMKLRTVTGNQEGTQPRQTIYNMVPPGLNTHTHTQAPADIIANTCQRTHSLSLSEFLVSIPH
jgi:hypothetical protein